MANKRLTSGKILKEGAASRRINSKANGKKNVAISQLPEARSLIGDEKFPVVQGGETRGACVELIKELIPPGLSPVKDVQYGVAMTPNQFGDLLNASLSPDSLPDKVTTTLYAVSSEGITQYARITVLPMGNNSAYIFGCGPISVEPVRYRNVCGSWSVELGSQLIYDNITGSQESNAVVSSKSRNILTLITDAETKKENGLYVNQHSTGTIGGVSTILYTNRTNDFTAENAFKIVNGAYWYKSTVNLMQVPINWKGNVMLNVSPTNILLDSDGTPIIYTTKYEIIRKNTGVNEFRTFSQFYLILSKEPFKEMALDTGMITDLNENRDIKVTLRFVVAPVSPYV